MGTCFGGTSASGRRIEKRWGRQLLASRLREGGHARWWRSVPSRVRGVRKACVRTSICLGIPSGAGGRSLCSRWLWDRPSLGALGPSRPPPPFCRLPPPPPALLGCAALCPCPPAVGQPRLLLSFGPTSRCPPALGPKEGISQAGWPWIVVRAPGKLGVGAASNF